MNVQKIVEELTQVCIQMRSHLNNLTEPKEKETLILEHVKRFENNGMEAPDFPKGTVWITRRESPAVFLTFPLCS